MINSDQGSPNISKAKLIGQSERLWCVCFMFSPRYNECSCFSLSSQTWFSSPGVRDIPCKLQVKTLSYSQISTQKRKCWKNGKSRRISPSSFGASTMSIDCGYVDSAMQRFPIKGLPQVHWHHFLSCVPNDASTAIVASPLRVGGSFRGPRS